MIYFHTMDVMRAWRIILNENCPIKSDIEEDQDNLTVALYLDNKTKINTLKKLQAWYVNNPDGFYHMTGPRNRGPSKRAMELKIADEQVYC